MLLREKKHQHSDDTYNLYKSDFIVSKYLFDEMEQFLDFAKVGVLLCICLI